MTGVSLEYSVVRIQVLKCIKLYQNLMSDSIVNRILTIATRYQTSGLYKIKFVLVVIENLKFIVEINGSFWCYYFFNAFDLLFCDWPNIYERCVRFLYRLFNHKTRNGCIQLSSIKQILCVKGASHVKAGMGISSVISL